MILPADKGKATVIMDRVTTMLSDDKTYEKLKKDSTQKYKRELVSIMRKFNYPTECTEDVLHSENS